MNVTVENLAPCKKLLRVELDAKAVDTAFESMTKEFQKQVTLPGFRPGKAPVPMVIKKYEEDIKKEVKKKLITDSYRKAIDEQKIDVVSNPDIEEIQFGRGQGLQFAATVETAPDFELPEYKGLPVKRETKDVSEADVDRALDVLREQQAKFDVVQRGLAAGDIAVVNYKGTTDGKPLTEVAPTAVGLTEKQGFWIEMKEGSFIAGFQEQLVGAKAGDKRTVNVDFPADFVTKELAGKKGVYEVEVVEVREKALPPLDDELAKKFESTSLEALRQGVRKDLENELNYSQKQKMRNSVVQALLEKVNFELPESAVAQETKNVVYDIVRENTQRGASREMIEKEKENIYAAATNNAKVRVKLAFLVRRIAEKEDIKVSQQEVIQRVQSMAQMYQIPPEKFIKDLQARNGIPEVYDSISREKVFEFLENNAKVETMPAAEEKK